MDACAHVLAWNKQMKFWEKGQFFLFHALHQTNDKFALYICSIIGISGMQTITVTSDYGAHGYRRAVLMGLLSTACASARIVDLNQDITPFDIDEASFFLKSSYKAYAKGSIHIVCVHNYYSRHNRLLFFEQEGMYFIGPDNGVFSLVFEPITAPVYAVEIDPNNDSMKTQITRIAAMLLAELPMDQIGMLVEDYQVKTNLNAVIDSNQIRAQIVYIDRYGNAITNVTETEFKRTGQQRPYAIYFKRHDPILHTSNHYMSESIGSPVVSFNSQGLLEIAVNLQRADTLLGLEKGDAVHIEFQN